MSLGTNLPRSLFPSEEDPVGPTPGSLGTVTPVDSSGPTCLAVTVLRHAHGLWVEWG